MSELTESLRHMADDSMGMEPGDRQVFSEAAGHIEELDRLNAQLLIAANHYEDKSKELEAQLKAVRELLSVATCPDPNCDKKGTVCLGEYQHESGEVEQHLEQCQWCAERDRAQEAGE
jgi:hypothetical protein